jgi:hypothetical protein
VECCTASAAMAAAAVPVGVATAVVISCREWSGD